MFRSIWCDNGDSLSLLYAGTRALKRDVTRSGKRTHQGTIDDGVTFILRYYINNNIDTERQKGLDLILGDDSIDDIGGYHEHYHLISRRQAAKPPKIKKVVLPRKLPKVTAKALMVDEKENQEPQMNQLSLENGLLRDIRKLLQS